LGAWLDELLPVEKLPAVARQAVDAFVPQSDAGLDAAKAELLEALARLDRELGNSGPEGDRWKAYLEWDVLEAQLDREEGPELKVLDRVHSRYDADHAGLDLTVFTDVREALRGYVTTARAKEDGSLETAYRQLMQALPEVLESYRKAPTAEGAATLGRVIQWLEDAGQAPWMVQAVRRHYTRPNLFARIDADVVVVGFEDTVDKVEPVTDSILGASVRGTGHNVGKIEAELVPSDVRAEIHTVYRGTINSTTTAYKSPAQVHSTGVTQLVVRKPILFTAEGFSTLPATSDATTKSTIRSVRVSRPAAQRQASSQAYAQKSQAERISAQHAEVRANRRANEQAADMLREPQERFTTEFREPLEERGLFPKRLDFSTTEDAVHITGLQVGPYDLAAPGIPPAEIAQAHLCMQVHESMFNNFADESFAGRTVTEEEFRSDLERILGEVPERFEQEEDREPWKISFDRQQLPISVDLFEGQLRIVMRGRRYTVGDTTYPGMNVTALYKIVSGAGGLKAVRQGELEIFPPDFKPGEDRLSVREQTLRRMLERRFGKVFDQEIVPEPLELPGKWAKSGKYALDQWDIADGWMTMAWNRIPGSEPADAEAAEE